MKKIVSLLMVIMLMISSPLNSLADGATMPPLEDISNDPNYSCVSINFLTEMNLNEPMASGEDGLQLIYIKGSISKASSSSVTVAITTSANLICFDIGASITIERWINNQWTPYSSVSCWAHNVSSTSPTRTVNVPSGYYYRAVAIHGAFTQYSSQYASTMTKSIWVN